MRLRPAGMVAALIAACPIVASASDTGDALKLAGRIAGFGLRSSTVVLRALPAQFPRTIPLPHATLLGSVIDRDARSSGSVVSRSAVLYYDAADRGAVLRAYAGMLRRAGWVEHRLPLLAHGGFTTTTVPGLDQWCRQGNVAAGIVVQSGVDRTALTLRVETAPPAVRVECGTVVPEAPVSSLPLFTRPPGVTIDASARSNQTTTTARLTSALAAAAVFDAFAKQLIAAGWAPRARADAQTLISQTFTKTAGGVQYVALLSLYGLDATHSIATVDVADVANVSRWCAWRSFRPRR